MTCKTEEDCSCVKRAETWEQLGGRWICQAEKCTHHLNGGGCALGKISLTCDDNSCKWNKTLAPGIYGCMSMDVHLNALGRCLGFEKKDPEFKVTTTRDGDILLDEV